MPTATTAQADYTVFPSNSVGVGAGVTISIGVPPGELSALMRGSMPTL